MFNIRTIDEIFKSLLIEKQTLSSLIALDPNGITDIDTLIPVLTSGKAPEWVLWLFNTAVGTNVTEVSVQTAIDDINNIMLTQKVPTSEWYITKAKEFQFADTVVIDPVTYQVGYAVIDESKQIIGSATTLSVSNKLYLKVRRKSTNILSAPELIAFESYMNKVKAAGTRLLVQNYNGDELTLNIDIVYNGTYDINDVRTNVEEVINNYIENIEFDSYFISSQLIDNLQQLTEVLDPRFNESSALDSVGNTVNFTHEYKTNAGWCRINSLTPLNTTITYIPK